MGGIFGALHRDGSPVTSDQYAQAFEAMAHRGPDGQATWTGKHVFLAHHMLHTTPESLDERLPLVGQHGHVAITADARVDNRDQLIRQLHVEPIYGTTITDSEVILAAYQKWGMECPEHIIGDFAFAIWDQAKQRLFCARDPIGVKPFYFFNDVETFLFASELRSLLEVDVVPRRVNEEAIAHHLRGSIHQEKEITYWEKIVRLPGGHALVVEGGEVQSASIRRWEYWPPQDLQPITLRSDEEYAEAFREVFEEAVRCRLRSAFPVGAFLSGGLDSSSVACMARDLMAQRGASLHTFSAVWPSLAEKERKLTDEQEHIETVLDTGGFIPHIIRADEHSPLEEIETVLEMQGQLLYGTNFYVHLNAYKRARANNVRVLLDGLDGDTVVSYGHDYLGKLLREERWDEFLSLAEALEGRERIPVWRYADHYGTPHLKKLAEEGRWRQFQRQASFFVNVLEFPRRRVYVQHGLKQALPETALRLWRAVHRAVGAAEGQGASEAASLIREDFARRIMPGGSDASGNEPSRNKLSDDRTDVPRSKVEKRWEDITNGIWQAVMEMDDVPAAVHHVEPRSPFFDRRLIEFCVAMPRAQSLKGGWPRSILRRAMEGVLPPEIQWRVDKSNATPGFVRGLLQGDREKLDEAVQDRAGVLRKYVDEDALQSAYEFFLDDPLSAETASVDVFSATALYFWLKSLQDETSP